MSGPDPIQIGDFLTHHQMNLDLKGHFVAISNSRQSTDQLYQLPVMRKILRFVVFLNENDGENSNQNKDSKYSIYVRSVCTTNSSQFLGNWTPLIRRNVRLFGVWFDLNDLSCRKFRATAFDYSPYTEVLQNGQQYAGIEVSYS